MPDEKRLKVIRRTKKSIKYKAIVPLSITGTGETIS